MEENSAEERQPGASRHKGQEQRATTVLCGELPKVPGLQRVYGVRPTKKRRQLLDSSDYMVGNEDRSHPDGCQPRFVGCTSATFEVLGGEKEVRAQQGNEPVRAATQEDDNTEPLSDPDMSGGPGDELQWGCLGHQPKDGYPNFGSFTWRDLTNAQFFSFIERPRSPKTI